MEDILELSDWVANVVTLFDWAITDIVVVNSKKERNTDLFILGRIIYISTANIMPLMLKKDLTI
jgi:hypothetical protein